jgi:hypothetical protein
VTTPSTILPSALIPLRRFDTKSTATRTALSLHLSSESSSLSHHSPHLIHYKYTCPITTSCGPRTPGYFQSKIAGAVLLPKYQCCVACAQRSMSNFLQYVGTPQVYTHKQTKNVQSVRKQQRTKVCWEGNHVKIDVSAEPSCDGI